MNGKIYDSDYSYKKKMNSIIIVFLFILNMQYWVI